MVTERVALLLVLLIFEAPDDQVGLLGLGLNLHGAWLGGFFGPEEEAGCIEQRSYRRTGDHLF